MRWIQHGFVGLFVLFKAVICTTWFLIEMVCSPQLEIKSWLVTGDSLSMELLTTEKGNRSVALSRVEELQNTSVAHHKTVRIEIYLRKDTRAQTQALHSF